MSIRHFVDFMIEDIMTTSDEEILAETSPEELEEVRQTMDRAIEAAMMGPPRKQKQTALQLSPGGGFRVVELDDDGKVIEPVRCGCGRMSIMHAPSCPLAYACT